MKRKGKLFILLVISVVLLISSVSTVSAGGRLIVLKHSNDCFYTVLGVIGEDDYAPIQNDMHLEGAPEFLIFGLRGLNTQNVTFYVNVYSYYERIIVNNTEVVNASLIESNPVFVETRGISVEVEILVENEEYLSKTVYVKIGVVGGNDNAWETFGFWFTTVWDLQPVSMTNGEVLWSYGMQNWLIVIVIALLAFSIAVSFMKMAYYFPKPTAKPVITIVWLSFALMLFGLGLMIRPPDFWLMSVGVFVFLLYLACVVISYFNRLELLEFEDMLDEDNKLVHVAKINHNWCLINPNSVLDAFLRCFGIYQVLPVDRYLRRQKGNIHWKVHARNVQLSARRYRLQASMNAKIAFMVVLALGLAGLTLFLPEALLIPANGVFAILCVVGFVFIHIEKYEQTFEAEFLNKTGVRLTAQHLAEDYRALEEALVKQHKVLKAEMVIVRSFVEKVKLRLKGNVIIRLVLGRRLRTKVSVFEKFLANREEYSQFILQVINEIKDIAQELQDIRENSDAIDKATRKTYQAGVRISELIEEIDALRLEVDLADGKRVETFIDTMSSAMKGKLTIDEELARLEAKGQKPRTPKTEASVSASA